MAITENKSERIEVRTTSNVKALLQRVAASMKDWGQVTQCSTGSTRLSGVLWQGI